ncbi:kinase inhibitor [Chitiniphilus shinanonensis]|uniref:Kinase inhibitor n=1 Tax=Chitiniphilus shinanonensis TaxID=553088 RepID=A0ABQ6BNY4_9NEIS|nr:YbhB/YbcL family Raf kinase inhibitor-like protein [Chitiniphilus shinanonensis]GLS02870.1 kinase inhibitor [Chitiniphilus shinanonensis]
MKRYLAMLAFLPALAWADFTLTSSDAPAESTLSDKQVYIGYGCNGGNTSPALKWQGAPAGTQSYALVLHDPDAPVAGGWYHWIVYNIPAGVTALPTGAGVSTGAKVPKGAVQGLTSFGGNGFGGACPPIGHGRHRYNFVVYALKVKQLKLAEDASPAEQEKAIQGASLGQAGFTAYYQR